MSHSVPDPELDHVLLADWCAYCDASVKFDTYHFSTILMGVFVGALTPGVDAFLRKFAAPFGPPLYKNLVRICSSPCSDRDILPWIKRDLTEKLRLLDDYYDAERRSIESHLAANKFTHLEDYGALTDIACASSNFDAIYNVCSEYMIDHCSHDHRRFGLREALYHISTSYEVADAIMSPLIDGKVDLGHYFEVYLRGGRYVVGDDSIVVHQFEPPPETA